MNSNLDGFLSANNRRILALEARYRSHLGINRHVVTHWIGQFDPDHWPLALKILESIRYFNYGNLRALVSQAAIEAPNQFPDVPSTSVKFVIAGDIWEGDATIARLIRNNRIIPMRRLMQYTQLRTIEKAEVDGLVFIKDFSGTGEQLADWWWSTAEPLVLPLEVPVVLSVLVLNHPAKERLNSPGIPVISSHDLEPTLNILSDQCTAFTTEEKESILEYCARTGAPEEYMRGRGGASLLVAFDYGCSNYSLPILWWNSPTWSPLFQRRAY